VPGNLIYANGHRFLPRYFHFEAVQPTLFQVDTANEAVLEVGSALPGASLGLGVATLTAVPMCDVDLPHHAQISDEEDYRFQLAVSTYGYQQPRHGEGKAYKWGTCAVLFRRGVHLRMVNVGAAMLVRSGQDLGYPVCLVCGQSRSPLASAADLSQFAQDHQQRCGKPVQRIGFFSDVVADALCFRACGSRKEGYSIVEALRHGAVRVLEMELEDLQILAAGSPGDPTVDFLLYDPMPGGSGLLEEMIERWPEVVREALAVVSDCPGECDSACVDCLLNFRNAYYHRHLDRGSASEKVEEWGSELLFTHDIPPLLPASESESRPVNKAEDQLREMLKRAGFADPKPQKRLELERPLGSTTPDFFYDDPAGRSDGICIYLDGLSTHIHGNPETRERDHAIREELRAQGYEVFEIPYGQLSDAGAMARHFYRLGRLLLGKQEAETIRDSRGWFAPPPPEPPGVA
jgi:hypothetical protein